MSSLLFQNLSYIVNGILFSAHNTLGQFANEKQYADLIEQLFKQKNIRYEREKFFHHHLQVNGQVEIELIF